MSLMGADSIFNFIKARGYTISSSEENMEGDINLFRSGTVIGKYINETTPIDIYLEHSHDILQPEGGHASQLKEVLGLRLILDQYKIPYNEIPTRYKVSSVLREKAKELEELALQVNPIPPKK